MNRKLWAVCLAVFLLLWGLFQITNFQMQFSGFILGALAIAAAVLLFLDK